jgi:hypothetical protein
LDKCQLKATISSLPHLLDSSGFIKESHSVTMLFIRRYVDSYHACIIHLKIQKDQKVGKNKIQVANSQLA